MTTPVTVVGGGPAGSSAALAALAAGAEVRLYERSRLPRHKVCGEFLSPETVRVLDGLGVWPAIEQAQPALIHRMEVYVSGGSKKARLPEPGLGLSRFAFDRILLDAAVGKGAQVRYEALSGPEHGCVWAVGRTGSLPRGDRLFGFKSHWSGPTADAVELYFSRRGYTGVNAVEGGVTNVCGLAPETALRRHGFDFDAWVSGDQRLRERLAPLRRITEWFTTGPLRFGSADLLEPFFYQCGDAQTFIDPFTGSGMLRALLTGRLAGACAAGETSFDSYLKSCRELLEMSDRWSGFIRRSAGLRWAGLALPLIPGALLFRATRPRLA